MLYVRNRALAFLAVIAWRCADFTAPPDPAGPWGLEGVGLSVLVLEELPAVCGTPTKVDLIADGTTRAGTVEVTQDGQNLYVVYRTDQSWTIGKTALAVGTSAEDIPTTSTGSPRIGLLHRMDHWRGELPVRSRLPDRPAVPGWCGDLGYGHAAPGRPDPDESNNRFVLEGLNDFPGGQ